MTLTKLERVINRARDLRPRTKQLYLQHVRTFIAFAGPPGLRGGTSNWTSAKVDAWRDDMQARGIAPQSINVALNALQTAAQKAQYKFVDNINTLEVPEAADTGNNRALTWSEGKRLIDACTIDTRARDRRDYAIVTLGLRTGMLRFSMCQLSFENLDLTARPNAKLTFVKKGGALHTIELDPDTHNALQAWVDWLVLHGITTGRVFRSLGRERIHHDFISASASVSVGDKLTPDGLYRALGARAVMAGLANLTPHVFHATFVAWARRAKASDAQIACVTGGKLSEPVDGTPANFLIRRFTEE